MYTFQMKSANQHKTKMSYRTIPFILRLISCLITVYIFSNGLTASVSLYAQDRSMQPLPLEIQYFPENNPNLKTGAEQPELFLPLLAGKRVAVVANHTSLIGTVHLVDSLLSLGIQVVKIFSPEHGFRGNVDAGDEINDTLDIKTGLPIVSLYGKKKKPDHYDFKVDSLWIDLVVFDMQDVGVRFYTYISTLTYMMEACALACVPLMIFDRPNPNGHYVDGPVLQPGFESFVGLHPVPVVHGMTIGEYARMVNGEYWLPDSLQCDLTVIPVKNYDHHTFYQLPEKPSPNLNSMTSVYLYPSVCFFEGTSASLGRGTMMPFRIIGHPYFCKGEYSFTPVSIPGMSARPPLEGIECYGYQLEREAETILQPPYGLKLGWLLDFYNYLNDIPGFFIPYFDKLAGTDRLRLMIMDGCTEEEIRESWSEELDNYRKIRKKYLMYKE